MAFLGVSFIVPTVPLHYRKRHFLSGGFTLPELIITITVIALLASLLTLSVSRAKAAGQATVCRNNLRQMGMALEEFAD